MNRRRIIVTEENEDLEDQGIYLTDTEGDAMRLLRSILLPGELARLARRMVQAKASGNNILVGIEFTRGHARRIVYHESEVLERE